MVQIPACKCSGFQLITLLYQKQLERSLSQCLIVCVTEPFSSAAYVGALRTQMNRYMLQFVNSPKQQYVGPHSVEIAICLAVINFNNGAVALDGILQEFRLKSGYYMEQGLKKTDTKSLYYADRKHSTGKKRDF